MQKMVGNGGLSIRNVKSSLNALNFIKSKPHFDIGHEDYFWCFYVPQNYKKFKIADFKSALSFSFDTNHRDVLTLINIVFLLVVMLGIKKLTFGNLL
jgi:hypothetical protein